MHPQRIVLLLLLYPFRERAPWRPCGNTSGLRAQDAAGEGEGEGLAASPDQLADIVAKLLTVTCSQT